jgi:hypothetical protein
MVVDSHGGLQQPSTSYVVPHSLQHKQSPPSFLVRPKIALFPHIDLHCCLQNMDHKSQAPLPEEDEVTYYVNKDYVGWVEQQVRRHVYIEMKLECNCNRSQNIHNNRDDWLCLYYKGSSPCKLWLTNHHVGGCPCGRLDSSDLRWELLVYPNLKMTK